MPKDNKNVLVFCRKQITTVQGGDGNRIRNTRTMANCQVKGVVQKCCMQD